MADEKKKRTGLFARWKERRRAAGRRAAEIQGRTRAAREAGFERHGHGTGGDGPGGATGGF
jgi:hypothetical protein